MEAEVEVVVVAVEEEEVVVGNQRTPIHPNRRGRSGNLRS